MTDSSWLIPGSLLDNFPGLCLELSQVAIPYFSASDQLIWKNSSSGELSFKDAFLFCNPAQIHYSWSKLIWNAVIPPSKSFVTWRLFQNRLPIEDLLQK